MKIKRLAVLPVAALAFSVTAIQFSDASAIVEESWGPQNRETYTWTSPADHVTFNSITDNPTLGDERNFVRVKEYGTEDDYTNTITIEPGKEYEVLTYFHNNASASLNASGVGMATGTFMQIEYPDYIKAGQEGVLTSKITAENATPNMVWDTAIIRPSEAVYINYVPNSTNLHNNGSANGTQLNGEALRGDGVSLAYWGDLWGIVPGCNEYAGYVTYRFKVDKPNFEISKQVTISELPDSYKDEITALPGDTLNFKITYKNTGTTEQDVVLAHDILPNGLTYINGTTYTTTTRNPQSALSPDALFGENGLGLGAMVAGEEATVSYQAKLSDSVEIFPCGDTVIYNDALVSTHDGNAEDKVKIIVHRACATTPSSLPTTGPGEAVMALLVGMAIAGGGFYFYKSQKMLRKVASGAASGAGSTDIDINDDIVRDSIQTPTKEN